MAKKITSFEQLYQFEQKRGNDAVANGLVEPDDQAWWFGNWAQAMKRFWDKREVVEMFVLEDDEIEDDQYGLAKFDDGDEYKMVYMCCSGFVAFMTFDN